MTAAEDEQLTREDAITQYGPVAAAPAEYLDVLFDTATKPRSEIRTWLDIDEASGRLVLHEKAEALIAKRSDDEWRARRADQG